MAVWLLFNDDELLLIDSYRKEQADCNQFKHTEVMFQTTNKQI